MQPFFTFLKQFYVDPPVDYAEKIKSLEKNQAVLIDYITALSRLVFIPPSVLKREISNKTANKEYIDSLYEKTDD